MNKKIDCTLISHICQVIYPLKDALNILVGQTNPPTVDGHCKQKKEHRDLNPSSRSKTCFHWTYLQFIYTIFVQVRFKI